jgi:hypothetical protein
MCDDCGKTPPAAAGQPTASTVAGAPRAVVAHVPQGFTSTINLRLVPARDVVVRPKPTGCQPREGATRRDATPVTLPDPLAETLKNASKELLAWVARDPANATLFVAQPVEALARAGVELSRADQKTLLRAHAAVRDAAVVPPGVTVTGVVAVADPRGRVGDGKSKPTAPASSDCGC